MAGIIIKIDWFTVNIYTYNITIQGGYYERGESSS